MERDLMNDRNCKSPELLTDKDFPDKPGVYCIRIKNVGLLPDMFCQELIKRNHNVVYIGIASQSLRKRFWEQELRAKGHGTFFRSLGAVLGFLPPKGSLKDKANKRNYKFSEEDENKIIDWIDKNLLINWIEYNGDLNCIETELITKHRPILNISQNPLALSELSELRAKCVKIANEY